MACNAQEVLSLFDADGHELPDVSHEDLLRMDEGFYDVEWLYEALGCRAGDYWLLSNRPGEQHRVTRYVLRAMRSENSDTYLCWTHRFDAPAEPLYDWEQALSACGRQFQGVPIPPEILWRAFMNLYMHPAESSVVL